MTKNFLSAYKKTKEHEGGYANDPDDKGGETYCGIARNHHPRWIGWVYIDHQKTKHGPIAWNTYYPDLTESVRTFYCELYWKKQKLEEISECSRVIAEFLFDTGVNCGRGYAGEILQIALNVTNNRQKLWKDIKVDGSIGENTLTALKQCHTHSNRDRLIYTSILVQRGKYYIDIMLNNESQEKYAYTWLDRLIIDLPNMP